MRRGRSGLSLDRAGTVRAAPVADARRWLKYRRYGFALLVVLGALVAYQYAGLSAARSLGLTPTPARFTELYFESPASLPTRLATSGTVAFRFAIVNREGAARTYRWTAVYSSTGARGLLANGATAVGSGDARVVAVDVAAPVTSGATAIIVRLDAPRQSIDYHVDVVGPSR